MTIQDLEEKVREAYQNGVTQEQAERLAGEFLEANFQLAEKLKMAELDARMRKSGLKAVKGAAYLEIVQKSERKPTEAQITAMLDTEGMINKEQENLDKAEVECNFLERIYSTCQNAHVLYRKISGGTFSG